MRNESRGLFNASQVGYHARHRTTMQCYQVNGPETHLSKLQHMQNRVLRTTTFCEWHGAVNIPYIYDYMTKICRQQAQVIQNHENQNVRNIGQGESRHREYKRLKHDGGQVYDRLSI
jgi:hypothetical protein